MNSSLKKFISTPHYLSPTCIDCDRLFSEGEDLFKILPYSKDLANHNQPSYFLVESKIENEGVVHYTYGIGFVENNILVDYVLDISTDFEKVKAFVDLCNFEKLSSVHFRDAVDDFVLM